MSQHQADNVVSMEAYAVSGDAGVERGDVLVLAHTHLGC